MKKLTGILLFSCALLGASTSSAQQTAGGYATLFNGFVVGVTVTNVGSGYAWVPSVTISGGGGSGATAYAAITNGSVASVTVSNAGNGYTSLPQVTFSAPVVTPFDTSIVLNLPFDGSAADVSTNHFNVTANGGTYVADRNGQAGSALSLNGVSDFVSIPYNTNLYPTEMTLSLWANFQNTTGGIWRAGNSSSDSWRGFAILFNGSSIGYLDFTGSTYNVILFPNAPVVTGQWYHIVVTRTTNSAALFVNGIKIASATDLTPYTKPTSTLMSLGCDQASGFINFCQMIMDNAHIYNRALSELEVQTLYASESGLPIGSLTIQTKLYVRVGMNLSIGQNYQLESSSNLVDWNFEGSIFTATNSLSNRDFPVDLAQQYYRLLKQP